MLPALLKSAGYETAAFGKSAPMDDTSPGTLAWGFPVAHGFDTFLGQPNQAYCHNMYPESITTGNVSLPLPLNHKAKSRDACMAAPSQYNYTTDIFTDAATRWLHGRAEPDRPFFLYVSYTVPHAGGWGSAPAAPEQGAPVPSDLQFANRSWPLVERDHAASVAYLDGRVGDLLNTLETLHYSERTVVSGSGARATAAGHGS